MLFINIVKTTINEVMGSWEDATSFEEFKSYLDEHGWPIRYPLPAFRKTINLIIKEKLPSDPEGELLDTLLGQTKKAVKLTKKQRGELKLMLDIAGAAKKQECSHENIGIAPFLHGGGFSPVFAKPEVICLDCGLNISFYSPRDLKVFKKEFGVSATKKGLSDLFNWAQTCMKNSRADERRVRFAEEIAKDPIAAYNAAEYKWEKKIPFKITDAKKFESKSGQ